MVVRKSHKRTRVNLRADIYKRLAKLAKDAGQTPACVLDQAAQHYLQFLAPAEKASRPQATSHARRSTKKKREAFELLAW